MNHYFHTFRFFFPVRHATMRSWRYPALISEYFHFHTAPLCSADRFSVFCLPVRPFQRLASCALRPVSGVFVSCIWCLHVLRFASSRLVSWVLRLVSSSLVSCVFKSCVSKSCVSKSCVLRLIPYVLCLLSCVYSSNAQKMLTATEAVQIALENNYDIRLTRSDADIANLNNTKGNAGMLPIVNLVANETFTLSTFQQQLSNGNEFNALGAPFNNINAAVQLNWTLFDGKRMQMTKRRLEETAALGQLNLRNTVQQTAASVLQQYYDITRGRLTERALTELITLNEERLRIAEARLAAGFAAQTDALQAKIDLNQRRSDLLIQQTATAASKRALNNLLARDPSTEFETDDNLVNDYRPERADMLQKMQNNNAALLALQKNADVAALAVEEAARLNRLRINGVGQFTAIRADNGAGFLINNTQAGIVVGAGLVKPLYSGGNLRRQVDIARINAQQALLRREQQQLLLETELDNQLDVFQNQQQILVLEEENTVNARESLKVSTERFRLGQTNALEVQIAQNVLEQVLTRRNLSRFNLKTAEVRLKLLAGDL